MQTKKYVALIGEVNEGFAVVGEKVRGVAVASYENGGYTVRISVINLAPISSGEYRLYYDTDGVEIFEMGLSGGELRAKNVEDAAFAIVYDGKDGEVAVAYGCFSMNGKTVKEIMEDAKNIRYGNANGGEEEADDSPYEKYDDEVVATENYYDNADVDCNLRLKEAAYDGADGGENENGGTEKATFEKEKAESYDFGIYCDEEVDEPFDGNYFDGVKTEIDKLFREFPQEKELSETVPDSKWVKVDYSDGKFYVVGVIYDNKKQPLYICYGVAGRYGKKPEELKEYCSFIPSSPFRLKGDGFWVMYQDAVTGECLKV